MNEPTSRWAAERAGTDGAAYDERWRLLEASGRSVHGEADFVEGFRPASVLDAGCGTGRVAIELAARGIDAVGVDLDDRMLATAREKAPGLRWITGSVEHVDLAREFDVVVTAGNVMIYVAPGTHARVVADLARHVAAGGVLVSGFQLGQGYGVEQYDAAAARSGLVAEERYAGWDREPWTSSAGYAVTVHRRPLT